MRKKEQSVGTDGRPEPTTASGTTLERHSWRNWVWLVAVSMISTGGLVVAVWPIVVTYLRDLWPWVTTGPALLVSLLVSMTVILAYLTHRERQVAEMRSRIIRLQAEAAERAQRNYSRLLGLFNVSRLIGTGTDLQAVFDCITKMCVESFNCQRASFMVVDRMRNELVVRSAVDQLEEKALIGARRKIGEGIAGWVAKNRQPVLLGAGDEGIDNYLDLQFEPRSMSASMVVPVMVQDDLVGVLSVSSEASHVTYDENDLRVLWVFADNAATYIRQIRRETQSGVDPTSLPEATDGQAPTPVGPLNDTGER